MTNAEIEGAIWASFGKLIDEVIPTENYFIVTKRTSDPKLSPSMAIPATEDDEDELVLHRIQCWKDSFIVGLRKFGVNQ